MLMFSRKQFHLKNPLIFIQKNSIIVVGSFLVECLLSFFFNLFILGNESLDDFFHKKLDLPLLSMNDYEIVTSQMNFTVINNNQSYSNKSLVDYSDSD